MTSFRTKETFARLKYSLHNSKKQALTPRKRPNREAAGTFF